MHGCGSLLQHRINSLRRHQVPFVKKSAGALLAHHRPNAYGTEPPQRQAKECAVAAIPTGVVASSRVRDARLCGRIRVIEATCAGSPAVPPLLRAKFDALHSISDARSFRSWIERRH